jgi:pantoate--beta-alanine ligase
MLKIFDNLESWLNLRREISLSDQTIGFVPTMGNLHAGHKSLLELSKNENTLTLLSIYVNPTQFNNVDDLKKYPKTLNEDLDLAEKVGVDFVLLPNYQILYPDNYKYRINESELSKKLCGKFRPGHFDGVLTVVLKLLQLVKPTRAYFGEKDFQQLQLVRGMVEAFFIDTEIVACPIVRDAEGLALSSRNSRLTADQLILARKFAKLLQSACSSDEIKQKLVNLGFDVDYIEDIEGRRFAAVSLGGVRLIDNLKTPI